MVLASQIVHVTSEAMASPTMIACTTMSAFTNMFQGDRLRGSSATSVAASAAPGEAATPMTVKTTAKTAAFELKRIMKSNTPGCMVISRTDDPIG